MSNLRFNTISKVHERKPLKHKSIKKRSAHFGEYVFSPNVMRQYVSEDILDEVVDAIYNKRKINGNAADLIALGMKEWAISKGVTHYSHWFQPLSGTTAEKHDGFLDLLENGMAIEQFQGSQLIQQEPEAASFPNVSSRSTFEARGYSAWDPSSSAFIYGSTLCIPTIFVSFNGEALDYKTPLLRSINILNEASVAVCKYFDKNVKHVKAQLGWEQEFYLIDRALFNSRPDLVLTGRTLVGQSAAKGHQINDNYFGTIPNRVMVFLKELEDECTLLGIPLKTRHNEAAPNQFEIAPIFEEANLSIDHNSLLMDVMDRISERHFFKVLFHEKPFDYLNGSGKHNNWSLSTDTGINLLKPGKTPMGNLQFLAFFINTIKAVNTYESLLRASITSASNDLRLGRDEAPPNIISVFIGEKLSKVLQQLEKVSKGKLSPDEKTDLKLNIIGRIPEILLDNTDRNRTSPFAFTGNKFEFRAVGSKTNCANPITVLNTIVANQLLEFKTEVDLLISKKDLPKDDAIFNVLRDYIKSSKHILYEGNSYSEHWVKEAKKRGLSHALNTPEALKAMLTQSHVALFEKHQVLNKVEVNARYTIELEDYIKRVQIEGRVLSELVFNHIIPSAINYQNVLLKNVEILKSIYNDDFILHGKSQLELIEAISKYIRLIKTETDIMVQARKKANVVDVLQNKAIMYCNSVRTMFENIRYNCDKLELIVDDNFWSLPKYRELLYTK